MAKWANGQLSDQPQTVDQMTKGECPSAWECVCVSDGPPVVLDLFN